MINKIILKCMNKFIEVFMSVKVWTLIAIFYTGNHVITIAATNDRFELISAALTFITTMVGTVIVIREGTKITYIVKGNNLVDNEEGDDRL